MRVKETATKIFKARQPPITSTPLYNPHFGDPYCLALVDTIPVQQFRMPTLANHRFTPRPSKCLRGRWLMRPGKKRHGSGKILYGGSSSGMHRVRQRHSCTCVDLANPFILDRHATYCTSCAVHNLESASYAPQAPSMLKYTCRWHVVTGPPHHHSLVQRLNWMLFRCSCISLFWRAMPRQYPA